MFNQVILIGNLGMDPEFRYTPSGAQTCRFSLATSRKFDSNGQTKEETQWHNIVAWGKLAEICAEYLHKGKQVMIEGEIRYESWEKDGQKHYSTKIVARTMKMLGRRQSEGQDHSSEGGPVGGEDDFPF